jgi:hypothetical protein
MTPEQQRPANHDAVTAKLSGAKTQPSIYPPRPEPVPDILPDIPTFDPDPLWVVLFLGFLSLIKHLFLFTFWFGCYLGLLFVLTEYFSNRSILLCLYVLYTVCLIWFLRMAKRARFPFLRLHSHSPKLFNNMLYHLRGVWGRRAYRRSKRSYSRR